jgi:hypothetical protein
VPVRGLRITGDHGAITAIVVGLRDCQDEVVAPGPPPIGRKRALPAPEILAVVPDPRRQGGTIRWYGRPVDDAERSVEPMASSRSVTTR